MNLAPVIRQRLDDVIPFIRMYTDDPGAVSSDLQEIRDLL